MAAAMKIVQSLVWMTELAPPLVKMLPVRSLWELVIQTMPFPLVG